MSRTRFRVNPHSIFDCMLRNSLLEAGAKSEISATTTGLKPRTTYKDGSRAAAASKMEYFVIIVNGWKLLTIITKHSILNVAVTLDPPLT